MATLTATPTCRKPERRLSVAPAMGGWLVTIKMDAQVDEYCCARLEANRFGLSKLTRNRKAYTVTLGIGKDDSTCTCPGWTSHRTCKHRDALLCLRNRGSGPFYRPASHTRRYECCGA